MYQIQQVTADANQFQDITLPDGTILSMTLQYSPNQYGWFMSLSYGSNFTVNNIRVCVSPDILYQWKNILPFGLGCFQTTASREPTQQQDFSSNLFQLYILTEDEVAEYTAALASGTAIT